MPQKKFNVCLLTVSILFTLIPVVAAPLTATNQSSPEKIQHLLNRITFGCTYSDIGLATKLGIDKYIEVQLHPEGLSVPNDLDELSKAEALQASPADLFIKYGRPAIKAAMQNQSSDPNIDKNASNASNASNFSNSNISNNFSNSKNGKNTKNANKKEFNKIVREANERLYADVALNRIARAVESPRQLEEVMTDFWFNHFNVSSDKGLDHLWVGAYEEKAIRPHALGKFRNLLGATAHHAAMLFYLDNWQNSKAQASIEDFTQIPGGSGNKNKPRNFRGINENYARELMELHTLGVDGGYTQKDVTELARVLTGLGMVDRGALMGRLNRQMRNRMERKPAMKNRYIKSYGQIVTSDMLPGNKILGSYFDESRHDYSDKFILGQTIKGEGEKEIEKVLDLLAKHPSTAKHISFKLAQYFVCDKPPQTLVNNLSQVYLKSDGDIAAVLSALFHSDEFFDPKYQNAKFKSPYRYLISTLRATDTRIEEVQPALNFLRQAGMPLYKCQTPDGYKNTQDAWLNPDNLINRLNFAAAFCSGRLKGVKPGIVEPNTVSLSIPGRLSDRTVQAIKEAYPSLQLTMLLGSPEFMKY